MKTIQRISLRVRDIPGDSLGAAALVSDETELLSLKAAADRFGFAIEEVKEIPSGTRLFHAQLCDDGKCWTHRFRTAAEIDLQTPAFTEDEQALWDQLMKGKVDTFDLEEQDVSVTVKLVHVTPA